MPRDLPLSNGRLHLNFDSSYQIRDLLFPHVGRENHTLGRPCRFGIWVDGSFSWINADWAPELRYARGALVTDVRLARRGLGIELRCEDAVDFRENVYLKRVRVRNLENRERVCRLYLCLDLNIGGAADCDTAFYEPRLEALVHYKGPRYFLLGGRGTAGPGLTQWATGYKGVYGLEGTWRDAEDGALSGNPICQGSVDSAAAVTVMVPPQGEAEATFWLAAGVRFEEVRRLHLETSRQGVPARLEATRRHWRKWLGGAAAIPASIPAAWRALEERCLLVMASQVDAGGGVLASEDSDLLQHSRDCYNYVWPRDGAFVAHAFDRAGLPEHPRRYFEFLGRVVTDDGYFLHKYNADGSLGSSWHPWYREGVMEIPLQEDETGLVLWALAYHVRRFDDWGWLERLYPRLVQQPARFLTRYTESRSGLPVSSYDLWEERRAVHAFTVGAVIAGLRGAATLAEGLGDTELHAETRDAAEKFLAAMQSHFGGPDCSDLPRSLIEESGSPDLTPDASLLGLITLDRTLLTREPAEALFNRLSRALEQPKGGWIRYPGDTYQRPPGVGDVPGNPWILTTLWAAWARIELAVDEEELTLAHPYLEWAVQRALPSGVLPEQVHPVTGEPWSVSPLTWSQAMFVIAVRRYAERQVELREGQATPGGASRTPSGLVSPRIGRVIAPAPTWSDIDPICQMRRESAEEGLWLEQGGRKHWFCSRFCRDRFLIRSA